MQKGISDEKTRDLYFSSHDSPTFWKKTKGGQYVIPAFFPNSLWVANSQKDEDTFWSLGFIWIYLPSRCFCCNYSAPDSEDSEESHFYSINNPLFRSNVWSPFGSLPLVTRGIGLRVHKMGAFRSWLWLKIGPKTQRNVWRKRRWI